VGLWIETVDRVDLGRPEELAPGESQQPVAELGDPLGHLQPAEVTGRPPALDSALERFDRSLGDGLEAGPLLACQRSRLSVHHADGPEVSALGDQGSTGVEADSGIADHQRVVGEARVLLRIADLQHVPLKDGVAAEADVPGDLLGFHADAGLEPAAVGVDEGEQGDRRVRDPVRELHQPVEGRFRWRIENGERLEGTETRRFVRGQRGRHHREGTRLAVR